jgi:asparagine synthase (glutamine-hydrolysing)
MSSIQGWIDFSKDLQNEQITLEKISKTSNIISGTSVYVDACAALIAPCIATKASKGKEYTAIFSGQIYNKEEIVNKLSNCGYNFDDNSDTHLVLNSYIEWGKECLNYFNGTFALAIWEKNSKTIFLARDRIGVKPLFYYQYPNGILFASNIKTLMASGIVKKEVDSQGLKQLLLLGPARSPGAGIIKGVKELKMGTSLSFDEKGSTKHCYWKIKAQPHFDNLDKTVETTRELIDDAVIKQLKNCSCCMLSGGLDSSIISMLASKYYKENKVIDTYSVDYEGNDTYFVKNSFQPSLDSVYIEMMEKYISSRHKYIVLDNLEVARKIVDATNARDLPGMGDIDSSLLLFLQEIKKDHDVCLSGECADELFGGYPWYQKDELLYKNTFPWSDATKMRTRLFSGAHLEKDAEEFVKNEYEKTVSYTDYLDTDDIKDRRIREMFMLNFYYFMQTLLDRSDRMSEYAGMEVRVPFCDYRIVEYAFNMPWKYKALHGREKGIVREAYKDLLPYDIVFRKKNPYPKTYNPIFDEYVAKKAENLILDKESILYELVDKDYFDQLKSKRVTMTDPWYGQLMKVPQVFAYLIQLDTFFKNFDLTIV